MKQILKKELKGLIGTLVDILDVLFISQLKVREEFNLFTVKMRAFVSYSLNYSEGLGKRYEKDYNEMFEDYEQIPPKEMKEYIIDKLSKQPKWKQSVFERDLKQWILMLMA